MGNTETRTPPDPRGFLGGLAAVEMRSARVERLHRRLGRWQGCWLLRRANSCRLRWTNYLRPDLKRGLLTADEEQLVVDLHAKLGNRYTLTRTSLLSDASVDPPTIMQGPMIRARMRQLNLELAPLNQLRNIFGLGKREAESIMSDVKAQVYRKRLAKSFNSELAAAPSKAAFLQNICEELQFDPELASKIHEDIYKQKLQQFVADGELNKDEVEALMALQVRLCIPQETVDAVHSEICGRLFEKVVVEAISSVDRYDTNRRQAVRKAAQGLDLKKEAVMAIFSKVVRKLFLNYIQRAKAAGNRIETAKELKKMISFNTIVVSELLADIKGEPTTAEAQTSNATSEPEISECEGDDDEYEWEQLETLRKTRPDKELKEKLAELSQKEITLKNDLPLRDRAELYEMYLMFCVTGETTKTRANEKKWNFTETVEAHVMLGVDPHRGDQKLVADEHSKKNILLRCLTFKNFTTHKCNES